MSQWCKRNKNQVVTKITDMHAAECSTTGYLGVNNLFMIYELFDNNIDRSICVLDKLATFVCSGNFRTGNKR